jgi:hypothetical protein
VRYKQLDFDRLVQAVVELEVEETFEVELKGVPDKTKVYAFSESFYLIRSLE